MKRNWEYKKLGDVCDIICGQDYKSVQDDNGPYPIYGTGGVMGYASQYRCPANSIIIGRKGSINNPLFVEEPFWNVDTAFGMVPNPHFLTPKYFFYFCRNYDFTQHDVAVTIPSLRRIDLVKIQVPVPPLEEQSRIVAELDLLTGIIDKQNAQLKELDNLAQAIFYDMFGDPAVNEKRWDQKPFETICSGMTKGPFGSDIKKDLFVPRSNSTYKVYIQINAIRKNETLGDYYITKEYFEEKMHRFEVKPGDYIITCDGTLGKYIRLSESMERGIISASLLKLTLNKSVFPEYFEALWDNYILDNMKNQARNAALIHLPSAKVIGKALIPVPPLALQQSFADKIQSIEKQKETIRASIADTQKLLDYTMDKYYG